jgi:hypothetical protein
LAKFSKTYRTSQTKANELPLPSSSMYIPKSAKAKITHTDSKVLACEAEIKDLKHEINQYMKDF